jgi:hypothetical protein
MCSSKYCVFFGAIIAAAGIGSTLGFTQPEKPKVPAVIKQPEAPTLPEGPNPEEMEAMMKAMMPGAQHEKMMKMVGEWEGTMKAWMVPGMPPTESIMKNKALSVMGGRYMETHITGDFDMGGQKLPFEGKGTYAYNNIRKAYEATWIDNMGTGIMMGVGEESKDGKSIVWNFKFFDPMSGKESWMREVDTMMDDNTHKLEMYGPGPDGKEFKMMEIVSKRTGK